MNEKIRTRAIVALLSTMVLLVLAGFVASYLVWRNLSRNTLDGEHVTVRGDFIFRTEFPETDFAAPNSTVDRSSDRRILAAACQAFDDWQRDRNLIPDLMLLNTPGYLRSAELLEGEFRGEPAAFRVEELLVAGTAEAQVLHEMESERFQAESLESAEHYLEARRAEPSSEARKRFVVYQENISTTRRAIVRLEIPEDPRTVSRVASYGGAIYGLDGEGNGFKVPDAACRF